MIHLATIGAPSPGIEYIDRPTVKVVIQNGDKILILNNGLLPGGGIENNEDMYGAANRELQEELGASVTGFSEIGFVTQYRTFLKRKYLVYGLSANLLDFDLEKNPQDSREMNFKLTWLSAADAIELINKSIDSLRQMSENPNDDSVQGTLYNLMTSKVLLEQLI